MDNKCVMLKLMQERINNGEDPDRVIPWDLRGIDKETSLEIMHFALQVLPDGHRKECIRKKYENDSRTADII